MALRPFCSIFSLSLALPLMVAGCAGMAGTDRGEADKAKMETMLNTELMTGDSADKIEAFFQRHGIAFTYNPDIRRYAATVDMGDKVPLAVYVYTDTDKTMTTSLVQAPKPAALPVAMPAPRERTRDYIDIPYTTPPRVPR